MRQQALVLRKVADESLDGAAHHRVLAHQDHALAAQTLPDLVHLLGADIVDRHDEDGLVLLEQILELIKVSRLVGGFSPHDFFGNEVRIFKGWCVVEVDVEGKGRDDGFVGVWGLPYCRINILPGRL